MEVEGNSMVFTGFHSFPSSSKPLAAFDFHIHVLLPFPHQTDGPNGDAETVIEQFESAPRSVASRNVEESHRLKA